MRTEDFSASSPGELIEITGGVRAFLPGRTPRSLHLSPATTRLVGDARSNLGKLEAGVAALPNADLLLRPFQINESVLSSRIEGTQTTLVEALADRAAGQASPDADSRAVRNYGDALQLGLEELGAGRGISVHMLRQLHSVLMRGDPRHGEFAGKFREGLVGIGPPECRYDLGLARFIPPPPEHLQACIDDLATFLGERGPDDPLVRVALAHYQFEAIHPFADGNGRVGRLLLPLQMVQEGVIGKPWAYLSPQIESKRQEYVDRLYAVSTTGAFEPWLEFFLRVVVDSSSVTLRKLGQLRALEADFESRLADQQSQRPVRALSFLFGHPVITIPEVAAALGCGNQGARDAVLGLERRGIVTKYEEAPRVRGQRGRPPTMYVCDALIAIMSGR